LTNNKKNNKKNIKTNLNIKKNIKTNLEKNLRLLLFTGSLFVITLSTPLFADDPGSSQVNLMKPGDSGENTNKASRGPASKPTLLKKEKKKKERVVREKEAEGTKAPNRFDTDNIIKSKYEFHGQSLEVDTD
jgi:hypothetical protein